MIDDIVKQIINERIDRLRVGSKPDSTFDQEFNSFLDEIKKLTLEAPITHERYLQFTISNVSKYPNMFKYLAKMVDLDFVITRLFDEGERLREEVNR